MTSAQDDLEARIQQFENMANADPDNGMAHFSLGSAYLKAGRAAEAARSLQRCIDLEPGMSKAYELCGQAMIDAGWSDLAVEVLETGHELAGQRGDRLPQEAMAELLVSLGRQPKEIQVSQEQPTDGSFTCKRTGRSGTKLHDPPFKGPVGEWIMENISAETWREWIGQGTKVINELRLDFSREQDQDTYDQHMREFLGIDQELHDKLMKQ